MLQLVFPILFHFLPVGQTDAPDLLFSQLKKMHDSSWARQYQPLDSQSLESCYRLFVAMLEGDRGAAVAKSWDALGFRMEQIGDVWVVYDAQQRGSGFFVFAANSGGLCVQAPHSRYDRQTGDLALRLFSEHHIGALALNSCHRYKAAAEGESSDMAHLDNSVFQQFSRAWVRVFPDARTAQLHGFSKTGRKSEAGRSSDFIVSTGSRQYETAVPVADALAGMPFQTRVYGRDVFELGAVANQQKKMMRALGSIGFLHLEMSAEARTSLIENPRQRALLYKALAAQ